MKQVRKKLLLTLAVGFAAGVLWLAAIRFFTYKSDSVHHHANFALFVNGQQDKFDNFTFYEEVQSCGSDEVNNPRTRVHLHDNNPGVVHVHDAGATWGHLFANLGYTLGDTLIKTDKGSYVDGQGGELKFILNGQEMMGIANAVIRSEDVLLINYGQENQAALDSRFDAITRDAADYNKRNDPSGCTGTKSITFIERLKKAFSF